MARGKNAAKTASRQSATEAAQAPLLRRIAQLQDEIDELHRSNLEQQASHLRATVKLRSMLTAGTSEALEAMTNARDQCIQTIKAERGVNKFVLKQNQKVAKALVNHMRLEHGHTGGDAIQWLLSTLGEEGYLADGASIHSGMTAEQAYRLDLARGYRSLSVPVGDESKLMAKVDFPA